METLGVWLCRTRESKGVTLKEAEAATRVRARFLELLEAGDYAAFPGGEVQIRGFLRIYARYLGLSPDEVLARYTAETHPAEAVPPGAPSQEVPVIPTIPEPRVVSAVPPSSIPRWLNTETVMIAGGVLIVLLVVVTAIGYIISRNAGGEPSSTATAPAQAAPPGTARPVTPIVVTPTFPVNPGGGVTLALEASEHVWARVTVDGAVAFTGMLAPGRTFTWSGQETVVVDTGNGAALQVTVNGQPQGTMGRRNQVCTRAWGPTGEIIVSPPSP